MNKKLLFLIFSSLSLLAETTMCYKEDVTSISGIDDIKLDGGKCAGNSSINDMKTKGWSVDDINISKGNSGMNYIYILKNETQYNASDLDKIEQKIIAKLEKKKLEDEKKRIIEIKQKMSRAGKEQYVKQCQTCHGQKAELNAMGTSEPLISLNLEEMMYSIGQYRRNGKDNGNGIVMTPYAKTLTESEIKNIYSYILTLKPKKEESK